MRIELDLTQREADELVRARICDRYGVASESRACVGRELESAAIKLRTAIDRASRAQAGSLGGEAA